MDIFHERLKEGICSKNLSLSKFGRILGVSQQVISRWCKGEQIPNLTRFKQICEALEVSADWLLGLDIKCGGGYKLAPNSRRAYLLPTREERGRNFLILSSYVGDGVPSPNPSLSCGGYFIRARVLFDFYRAHVLF